MPIAITAETIPSIFSVDFFLLGFKLPAASVSTVTFDAIHRNTGLPPCFNAPLITSNTTGVNTRTVQAYMAHLEDAFLMRFVNHFSYSLKAQLEHPVKPYCVDTGLRNAVSFRFSEDRGWLMENLALLRLEGQGPVYYWKDAKGEVDFVLYEGIRPVLAVQVCHDMSETKVRDREVSALARAMRELRLKRGTVVTWDEEGSTEVDGKRIELVPMWRWLLE